MVSRGTRQLDRAPGRRVVLLGASNLTRGVATVVETSGRMWGRPLEVFAALGHGRSYGLESSVLGRRLPGIAGCELWDELARRPKLPTAALVTDIGNDLLYEQPLDQIVAWVERCLERLSELGADIVLTRLPVGNLDDLSRARFRFFRAVFVPRCRLDLGEMLRRAYELDARISALAARYEVRTVALRPEWYGLDPIHIRRRHVPGAWHEILSPWASGGDRPGAVRATLWRTWQVRRLAPARRWIFGVEQRREQPSGRLRDGTTIALY